MKLDILRISNIVMGLMLVIIGLVVIASPNGFLGLYGIETSTSDARSALRAGAGGVWLVLGIIFLWPQTLNASQLQLAKLGAILFIGVLIGRLFHYVVDEPVTFAVTREVIFEAAITLIYIWLGFFRRLSK